MATGVLIALTVLTVGLLVLAFSLYATVGAGTLNNPHAFAHDGPRDGRPAPRFQLATISGEQVAVPTGRPLILLFTDHSLMDFPELVSLLGPERGIDDPELADLPPVLVVARAETTRPEVLAELGLAVPAGVVPQRVYDRYRIRVMPYAVAIGADGVVCTSGLVNTAYQLRRMAYRAALTSGDLTPLAAEDRR